MKALLKTLAWLVGIVVVLVIVAAVVLPLVIDPNDYRDEIALRVEEATGRKLAIDGEMKLSVFPWLGLDIGAVALGNAPGFDDPVFAKVDKVNVRVKLLPLLRREVEMDTIALHGLMVNLSRNVEGRGNWEDLVEAEGAAPAPRAGTTRPETHKPGGMPVAALAIGGLDVRDASLGWVNAATGERIRLTNVSLRTGALAFGDPVDVSLELDVEAGDPALSGHVQGRANVAADVATGDVQVAKLEVTGDFQGAQLPGGKASLRMRMANATVSGAGQSVVVESVGIDALGMRLEGGVSATGPWTRPTLDGAFETNEFSPRDLLQALGVSGIETADPRALSKASIAVTLSGSGGRVAAQPMIVRLDESTLRGEVALPDLARPGVRFDLNLDRIDADRYLPPPAAGNGGAGGGAAATPGSAAASAGGLPPTTLRGLDLAGRLGVGRLKVSGLTVSDIAAVLKAEGGLVRLHPVSATLYQGKYEGNIALDARADAIVVRVDERLLGVQAGPLLKDLTGKEQLTGAADVHAQVSAVGITADAVKRSMNGQVRFAFSNGAYKGINVARKIREGLALVKGQRLEPAQESIETDFTELTGTVKLADGIARNDDLSAKSPLLRVEGKGKADLVKEAIDYRLTTTLVGTIEGQGGRELADLTGVPIPIRVTGTFGEPKYGLDQEALVSALARSKTRDLLDKRLGADKADKITKEGLEQEGKKLLRGLLGQ